MPKPLLSICIPTFNRAESLRLLLENISNECSSHLDKIEIVISDNASTDHTADVVHAYSRLPIRYRKNKTNIGGAGNILTSAADIATGEFVWIVGDDDLILPGGLAHILDSIIKNPQIDYHYINFGWIKSSQRDEIIKNNNPSLLESFQTNYQCDLKEWKLLDQLEDLAYIPGNNPSALFCCIFSFACRQRFFVESLAWIRPTYCTDGSTVTLDDWYPHAMASVTPVLGKPIAYIGRPCILQSVGAWEWKEHLSKALVFGVYELLVYFEGKGFDRKSLNHLWRSYYKMAGRIFSRMQCNPDENKGIDIVLKKSIPRAASKKIFWHHFMLETKSYMAMNYEANIIAHHAKRLIRENPRTRIGLWGIQGRSQLLLKNHPELLKNITWITDKAKEHHGVPMEHTQIKISPPDTLDDAQIDHLIIGTRRKFINEIIQSTREKLPQGASFITIDGIKSVKGSRGE